MPTVFLPEALAKELHCNSVEYDTVRLLQRPGAASLLSRILEKCDVEDDDASRWVIVNNTRDKVLDEAELRSLHPSARVHLSRADAQLPPEFVELRTMATTTATARPEGRPTQAYVSAEPSHDFLDFLCVNASVFDALLEWLDNAVKALNALPEGAPREVWFGFRVDASGAVHVFVRDSGSGMAPYRLEVWPSLGTAAREEPEAEHAPDVDCDPRAPYPPGLGQWRVGAKTGLVVLTAEDGRTMVCTRAAGDPRGLDGAVAYIVFDKAVARARAEASKAAGGYAEPGKRWFDLEAGVREPTPAQRGVVPDPSGGRWQASGTLVSVAGCSEPVLRVHRSEAAFFAQVPAGEGAMDLETSLDDADYVGPSSQIMKAVCMVFHSYIHKRGLDRFSRPPPPTAAGEKADGSGSDDESSQSGTPAPRGKGGKKGKVAKGKPAEVVEAPPLLKLNYCFITPERAIICDLSKVNDDLVSRMLHAGCSDVQDVFSLRLAFRLADQPGKVALAHITVIYYPYVDGAESRPEELSDITDGKLVVRRCGRTLQQLMKPMLLRIPFLGALGWPTDDRDKRDGSFTKALAQLRVPLQNRTAGLVDLSVTFTPKTDKSELDSKCSWTAALKAMSESSPENVAAALNAVGASVQMAMCGPGTALPASAADANVWEPFDAVKARHAFRAWASDCHDKKDKEAALSMPAGKKAHVFVFPNSFPGGDAAQFLEGQPRRNGDYHSGWRRVLFAGQRAPKVIPESPELPGQLRLLVRKAAGLRACKGYGPPSDEGYFYTLRLVMTPGAPPGDECSPAKASVVLDPWTVDPNAAKKTGIKFRDDCVGLELRTLMQGDVPEEQAGGFKSTAFLRRACVKPLQSLLQGGHVEWLSEEDWWDKIVRDIKPALPASLALQPALWKQASAADSDIRILPGETPVIKVSSGTVALKDFPFAVHRHGSRGLAEPLCDAHMQVRLSMREAGGRAVVFDGSLALVANHTGHGSYVFTVPLNEPGEYTLLVEAVPQKDKCPSYFVDIPPLTYRVSVAPPEGLVPPGQGACRGCVHGGPCVTATGGPLSRNALCPRLEDAALTMQLHAPAPHPQTLVFTQHARRPGQGATPVCWPATLLADDARYDIAFAIEDERQGGESDISLAAPPKLSLSANGLELRVSELRLAGGTLPAGDAFSDGASKHRALTAPIVAKLVLTVTDRGEDGSAAPVVVEAKLPLQVAPGPLHMLRPELEDQVAACVALSLSAMRTLRTLFGAKLPVGDTTLRASLRDRSGNLTADAPALRLALDRGFDAVGPQNGLSVERGIATLKLRLRPESGEYVAKLSVPSQREVVELVVDGKVPMRHLRLLPAARFADALRGEAGGVLDAEATATVVCGSCPPAQCTVDADFAGTLTFSDAAAPTSAWGKSLRDCDTPLLPGGAATPLPALPLPDKAGEHRLLVCARNEAGAVVARCEVPLRVAAGPATQLKLPPGAGKAAMTGVAVGAELRLSVVAQDRFGNAAALTAAQLASLQLSAAGRDPRRAVTGATGAVAVEVVQPPRAGPEPGAVGFAVRLSGPAPQEVSLLVKMPLPPAPAAADTMASDGSDDDADVDADAEQMPFASVTLRQKLQVGPPCASTSSVSLEGAAEGTDGYLQVRRGDVLPLHIAIRDAAGNAATSMLPTAAAELAAPPGCGVKLPHRAVAVWKNGVGRLVALEVAPETSLGRLPLRVRVWAVPQAPPMELPLHVRIEEGGFTSRLVLEADDGTPLDVDKNGVPLLVVPAGMPLALRIRALTAAGDAPAPAPAPPALLMRQLRCADGTTPTAPPLLRHLSEAAVGDAAAGAVFRLAGSPKAPEAAGDYQAELKLPAPVGSPQQACTAPLRVRITPCADGPLRLALRGTDIATDLVGLAEHAGGGVLIGSLRVCVADRYGNALAAEAAGSAMGGGSVRLAIARAVGADAFVAVPGPTAATPLGRDGTANFGAVVVGSPDWASGAYILRAQADGSSRPVDDSEPHTFEFRAASDGGYIHIDRIDRMRADPEAQKCRAAAEKAERDAEAARLQAASAANAARAVAAKAAKALAAMGTEAARVVADAMAGEAEPEPALLLKKPGEYVNKYRKLAVAGVADAPKPFGLVADLLRVEGRDVAARVAAAAGARAAWLLCRTQADVSALEEPALLGPSLVALPLQDNVDLPPAPAENCHHPSGQLPLLLNTPAASAPGFVEYLVNLVRLSPAYLAARVERPGGAGPARRLGLRATALYSIFGDAALFTTREAMLAHNAKHGAGAGLYCLESSACVARSGVRFGASAANAVVRVGVVPTEEWRATPLRADACAVLAVAAAADAERAAEARLTEATAVHDAAKTALAAARAAAPRPPAALPAGGRAARQRPEVESGAREAKRSRNAGA